MIALQDRKRIAKLIYEVLDWKVSVGDAIRLFEAEAHDADESALRALHSLYHYRDDEDIRLRDKDYAELQTTALRHMADTLSEGLPLSDNASYW